MVKIVKVKSSDHINQSSKEFSVYVAEQRAIPKVTDGLKSGARMALYLMMNRSSELKTASLGAEMLKELYVHGDASANDLVSKLAGPYSNNIPLFEGIGNFGTRLDPNAYSAPRYTYVKRSKFAENALYVDSNILPMQENYDGSVLHPITFLPIIPLVLLNGVEGIAVGWSTTILPRKLSDIIDACLDALKDKPVREILPHYDYLDCTVEKLTDDGSYAFYGKVERVNTSTVQITELPPGMTLERMKEHLDKLEDADKISDYTDSTSDKILIEVKMKRADLASMTDDDLVDFFKLKSRNTERLVVVDFDYKTVKQYDTVSNLIKDFVNWRLGWYVTRYEKELERTQYELKYYKTLEAAFDGGFSAKVMKLENKSQAVELLDTIAKKVEPDEAILDKVVSLSTYKWTKDYYDEVMNKIEELFYHINWLKDVLSSVDMRKEIYRKELMALKGTKFPVER